jgi:putative redox protein
MVKIDLNYQGELRVQAVHQPSGTILITDAPVDNQGKGQSFSPTDLVATALGTCMATIMGIEAKKTRTNLKGMEIHIEKHMSQDAPRRIQALDVSFSIPHTVEKSERQTLEKAALTCPVAQSIHPNIQVNVKFKWGKS